METCGNLVEKMRSYARPSRRQSSTPDIARPRYVPKSGADDGRTFGVVLDTSGSMSDEGKMEKARQALLYGIRILRPVDRFNVVAFAGEERLMETGLLPADDSGRGRGEAFVKSLNPAGGTSPRSG